MNIERTQRFRDFLRRNAAHHEDYCFQLFLWYPLPDGTWKIKFGRGNPEDFHLDVWEKEAIPEMAQAWGIQARDVSPGLGDQAILTGYVDIIAERGRDFFVLALPQQLPPGWTVSKVKDELKCEVDRVRREDRGTADPNAVANLIDTLEELQLYRSVDR